MFCRQLLPFLFAVFFFSSTGQSDWYHYNWDQSSSKDFSWLYNYIYSKNLNRYKDNIYIGQHYERFSKECAARSNYEVLTGQYYKDIGYDAYLRKVLCTVVPDTAITNHIKIILNREEDFNAYMNESGILQLNVGFVARSNNEAELAMLMGHEVAHFINEDVIKSFGRQIELENSQHTGISWGWGSNMVNTVGDFYWFNREQESLADFSSIKFMKKSPYSLKSGANLFRQLKRIEIRSELKYGKRDKIMVTHPDGGDRQKQVKFLSSDSLNKNKKNFVVDSLAFLKFKELCFDETVNICLQHNHISPLIDICFAKYLFEPENQNNLAVLIEAIRRILIFNKEDKYEKQSFILRQYQTGNAIIGGNYTYLYEENPSILKYLTKGFIDVGKEDVGRIKAKDLLDSSIVEFTTYSEAYSYFKQKAKDLNCKVCEHYKYFENGADLTNVGSYTAINNLFETNDYLNPKVAEAGGKKDLFIVLPTNLTKVSYILNRKSLEEEMDLYEKIVKGLEEKLATDVIKLIEMPYQDQHLLASLIGHCRAYLDLKPNHGIKNVNVNWPEVAPELYSLFKRNGVKNIFVCKLNLFHDVTKKSFEVFEYYKIALPEEGNTFSGEIKQGTADQHEGYKWYIDKLTSQFSGFYKITK
jgi:hypothetical protein